MSEKIYITIDGTKIKDPESIRGCTYSESNARALIQDDETDDVISCKIEDSRMDYYDGDNLAYCTCRYFSPKLKAITIMIHALYEMEGCSCGGICHIVTDDDNFDDGSLYFVLNECKKEENKDRIELELAEAICKALLKLTIQERALVFTGFYSNCLCDMDGDYCSNCSIEKGEKI